MRTNAALALIASSLLAACGATVGDPCTTASECSGQLCINETYTPGGYCSRQCTLGDDRSCPTGSLCVRDGLRRDVPACFRLCNDATSCRAGYACRFVNDSPRQVCIGTDGI